jgi:hypothetical protein
MRARVLLGARLTARGRGAMPSWWRRTSAYVLVMRKHIVLWACLVIVSASGCDVAEIADCGDICDTHEDCVGNIDITFCIDRCEDYADISDATEDQVDLCNDCYDDLGCSPDCNAQCDGIVPPL